MEGFVKETRVKTENILLILYMATQMHMAAGKLPSSVDLPAIPYILLMISFLSTYSDGQKKIHRTKLKGITNLNQRDVTTHIWIALDIILKHLWKQIVNVSV